MTTTAKIRCGLITGLFMLFVNLAIALAGHSEYGTTFDEPSAPKFVDYLLQQGLWALVDVAIASACTIALAFKSRVGAVGLLSHHLVSSIYIVSAGLSVGGVGWVFRALLFVPLWLGVRGTFEYHRAIRSSEIVPA